MIYTTVPKFIPLNSLIVTNYVQCQTDGGSEAYEYI